VAELPTQGDFEDFDAWTGRDVLEPGGERLGAVEEIYLDEATGVPEWVLVRRDEGAAFVPLAGASVEERAIRVAQDADRVAAAPGVESGETLTIGEVKRLYEHYGIEYSQEESPTVLPAEEPPAGESPAGESPPTESAAEERPRLRRHSMAPRNLSSATPSELPPPRPQVVPPPTGFSHTVEEAGGSRLRKIGIPGALASAIAGLILLLALRRRRR
jgi:hypothetical protein